MHAIRAAGLAACLVTGGALSAAATSYSAINFNDWSSVTLFGPSGGQVVAPIPIGGNPLATLSVSTLTNATTYTGHVSGGLSYDFSEGAIESIDVSLQYNPVQAFGDGHGVLSLLIEQGGSYYGAGLGSTGAAPRDGERWLSMPLRSRISCCSTGCPLGCRGGRISPPGRQA